MKNILWIFLLTFSKEVISQNVGINTLTPTRARLEVIGVFGAGATSGAFGTDGPGISLQRNWPTIGFNQYRDAIFPGSQGKYMSNGFAAIQYFDPGSGAMAVDMFPAGTANTSTPAGTRGLTIFSNGNTSIRTGNSNATLTVGRGDGFEGSAVFASSQHWSHFNYGAGEDTYIRGGTDGSNVYINKIPSGDVFIGNGNTRLGINKPAPTHTIDLIQSLGVNALSIIDASGYSWSQRVNHINTLDHGNGNVLDLYFGTQAKGRFQYWDGKYVSFSDRRLKTAIEPLPPVLDKLNQLNTVMYEMKNDDNHEKLPGFVAQEVQPLFPFLIRKINYKPKNGDAITDLQTMNYSGFGVIAVKALQEQWKQIQDLEKENEDLMARLAQIEKKLQ